MEPNNSIENVFVIASFRKFSKKKVFEGNTKWLTI